MVELTQPAASERDQSQDATTRQRVSSASIVAIAWRNLWRNRRRTWLSAGGIGFAVWMLVLSLSMQDGSFEIMIDNGSRLLLGHLHYVNTHHHRLDRIVDQIHHHLDLYPMV